MDPQRAPQGPANNQVHPLPPKPPLPAQPPPPKKWRQPSKAQREALCEHAGVGDDYTCCLTCLQPADAEHRSNWLDCAQCYAHGDTHVGDLCPLLQTMTIAFFRAHAGENKKKIHARTKHGRFKIMKKRAARRWHHVNDGGNLVVEGGLPGYQVLPEDEGETNVPQPDGPSLIDQGHETQSRRSESRAHGDGDREINGVRPPPGLHQGGGYLQPHDEPAQQLYNQSNGLQPKQGRKTQPRRTDSPARENGGCEAYRAPPPPAMYQGGGQLQSHNVPAGQVVTYQPNGLPLSNQGNEMQRRKIRSPVPEGDGHEAYGHRPLPGIHQGGGQLQSHNVAAEQPHTQPDRLPLINQGYRHQPPRSRSPTLEHERRGTYRTRSPPPGFGRSKSPLRFKFVGYEGDEGYLPPQHDQKPWYRYSRAYSSRYGHAAFVAQPDRPPLPVLAQDERHRPRPVQDDGSRVAELQAQLSRLIEDFGRSRSQETARGIAELSRELDAFAVPRHDIRRIHDAGGARIEHRGTILRSEQVHESEDGVLVAKDERGKEFYLVKAQEGARSVFRPDLIQ